MVERDILQGLGAMGAVTHLKSAGAPRSVGITPPREVISTLLPEVVDDALIHTTDTPSGSSAPHSTDGRDDSRVTEIEDELRKSNLFMLEDEDLFGSS